jgi:glutamate synthase domain-containing protein 3
VLGGGRWTAPASRRADPAAAGPVVRHARASELESRLVRALRGQRSVAASGFELTTADRSFGAAISGAIERRELDGPVRLDMRGSAGQSFGAFATGGMHLRLVGQANDYVAKGLSGGTVVILPEPDLATTARSAAIAGNTCLYGATGGQLHLVGRAGMRFAVRNSGADAVVEGIGPHGCEYMTGGTIVVLGPVGANFGAGMTGGRAYLYDPEGHHVAALHVGSVRARRLAEVVAARPDGLDRLAEFRRLVEAHRNAGSALAAIITLADPHDDDVWLVEPHALAEAAEATEAAEAGHGDRASAALSSAQAPLRNLPAIGMPPTRGEVARTVVR